jgi:hypothetical protein
MATKKKTVEQAPQEVAVVPKKELILEGDPERQLAFAAKASKALMGVVESKPKKVIINGKQYLEYGSWQTLGSFFGATAGTEWSKPIHDAKGVLLGYEARAVVNQRGAVISSAEAVCMKTERRWATADEYAIKSMAQTRAAAKALRNAFGWVAEMAGYQSTPAEEMEGVFDTPKTTYTRVRKQEPEYDGEETVVDGHPAEEPPMPGTVPNSEVTKAQRVKIKDLLDANAGDLLVSGEDYRSACKLITGMPLEVWHFKEIIEVLENYHGPKI